MFPRRQKTTPRLSQGLSLLTGGLKARTQALKVLKRRSLDNPLPAATTPPSHLLTPWFCWGLSAPSHCPRARAQRQILAGPHLASPLPISESRVPDSPGFLQLLVFHPGSSLMFLPQPPGYCNSSQILKPRALPTPSPVLQQYLCRAAAPSDAHCRRGSPES